MPGAKIVLFGAPFDSTTSFRPGARFGPSAIRRESYGLELYSPYQGRELTDTPVFDSGDIELPFGSPEAALSAIEERAAIILSDGKLPFLIGGEHLVTLGAVRAAVRNTPICTSCISTRTQTCATTTSGKSSRTPACCGAATS